MTYTVVVDYMGETRTRKTSSLSLATQWAETAVYEIGADYAVVENPDGSIYCEYEM